MKTVNVDLNDVETRKVNELLASNTTKAIFTVAPDDPEQKVISRAVNAQLFDGKDMTNGLLIKFISEEDLVNQIAKYLEKKETKREAELTVIVSAGENQAPVKIRMALLLNAEDNKYRKTNAVKAYVLYFQYSDDKSLPSVKPKVYLHSVLA